MGYYLADANGYVEDFASIGGLREFSTWSAGHVGTLSRFAREGFTDDPGSLYEALGRSANPASPALTEMLQALQAAAKNAEGCLIISDGTGVHDATLETLWFDSKTGIDDHGRGPGKNVTANERAAALRKLHALKPDAEGMIPARRLMPVNTSIDVGDAAFEPGETREVDPRTVTATQPYFNRDKVAQLVRDYPEWDRAYSKAEVDAFHAAPDQDGPPIVVEREGQHVALEGHHRLAAAKLLNVTFKAHVITDKKPRALANEDDLIAGFKFDATSKAAKSWIKAHAADTVSGVSATTREGIKSLLDDAFDGDFDVSELADRIEELVGDDARADTIARTETMTASNAGQRETWDQAVDAGVLTGDERQEWIVTPDDRLCPICEGLDGETAALGESFNVDGDELDGPPAHPNCRCTTGLVGGD